MNGETNDNNVNNLNGIGENQVQQGDNIENAFSDLISEFFEDGNNTQCTNNIQAGQVLDWDSVANGQLYTDIGETAGGIDICDNNTENAGTYGDNTGSVTTGDTILYNNLETINGESQGEVTQNAGTTYGNNEYGITTENTVLYNNLDTTGGETIGKETTYTNTTDGTDGVYKTFTDVNTENEQTIAKNAYGVVTVNTDVLNGLDNGENTETNNVQNETTTTGGTEFKLTQANLPAKIGFWTKVRNFFISDSKIQYSVDQATNNNGGVWNKLQNLFSFGKNK